MGLAESAWLIPAYSFASFFLIIALGRWLPGQGSPLSLLAIAAGFVTFWFVLAGYLAADCSEAFGVPTCLFQREWFTAGGIELAWGLIVDPLAIVMLGLVTLVALVIQVYSLGYMKGDPRFGWYFAVHSLFAAAMLTLVLADNFLLLYVAWELVGLGSYLLIGFWYERRSAAEAAKKAFVTTRIGDVALLIGILLLFKQVGTFDMSTIFGEAQALVYGEPSLLGSGTATAAVLLLFIGAMGKSAQFPFHVWLPDAMEGPTPVSALIHAATMVAAGVYLVARAFPLFEAAPDALTVVAVIGLITALMGASMAMVVTDLKRVLAYSTISHLGLMMLTLGSFGYAAAIFHLVAHGFSKAMLFLGAGSVMHSMDEETDIRKMGGLRKVMPVTALTFAIGALSLGGIPIFSGFWSKDEALLAVLDHRVYLLAFAFIVAFMSALYMARVWFMVFLGDLKRENEHVHESPWVMLGPMCLLGALTVVFGFTAIKIADSGGFGTFLFFDKPHGFAPNIGLMIGSILLAVAAFVVAWRVYVSKKLSIEPIKQRSAGALAVVGAKYYLDDLYQWVIDRVALAFSRATALFDRLVLNDAAVNGTGLSIRRAAMGLRYHVTGRLYTYALGIAVGAVGVALFWWLMTG